MTDQPVLERALLERLRRLGGDDLLTKVLALFRENAPKHVTAVRERLAAGDHTGAAGEAHSLVSTAGNVGAMELMQSSRDFEEAVRSGRTTGLPDLQAKIDDAYARLREHIDAFEAETAQ